ncbi:MAG: helix-turn-helix transcriptional regulator [Acetobacteraceae bacterium]
MAALHRDPHETVGWSRNWHLLPACPVPRFAELFMETVGEPPLRYLHRWRLAMASDLLRTSNLPVREIAHSIGYESEAAFSRAFKTMFGTTPRETRRN